MRRQPIYFHFRVLSIECYLWYYHMINKKETLSKNSEVCWEMLGINAKKQIFSRFFFFLVRRFMVVLLFICLLFILSTLKTSLSFSHCLFDFPFVPIPRNYYSANEILLEWTKALNRSTTHSSLLILPRSLNNFTNRIPCKNDTVSPLFISWYHDDFLRYRITRCGVAVK